MNGPMVRISEVARPPQMSHPANAQGPTRLQSMRELPKLSRDPLAGFTGVESSCRHVIPNGRDVASDSRILAPVIVSRCSYLAVLPSAATATSEVFPFFST